MANVKITEQDVSSNKKILGVQVPTSLFERLKKEADKRYISVSDFVRMLIVRSLNNDDEN